MDRKDAITGGAMEMVVVLRRRVSVRCMGVMRLFVRPVFMVGWHRRLVVRREIGRASCRERVLLMV